MPMSAVFVAMNLTRLSPEPESLSTTSCTKCGEGLNLHQPDANLPERLLATCPDCSAWFLIDGGAGLMMLLPDEDDLRNA
jgi:hypothetical protein